MTVAFLDAIAVERDRRMAGRVVPDARAQVQWDRALSTLDEPDRAVLASACEYAMTIDYRHDGLSSAIYAAHPLRVAAMAILSGAAPTVEAGIVGLVHNVLEVTDVGAAELERRFGDRVLRQVESLTVDRARQWNGAYKRDYYRTLNEGPVAARVVKVFDKLDNLYLLGLNDDADVKAKYLREIIEHIVPMSRRDVPSVAPYFAALVNETILAERLDLPAA